MKTYDDTNLQVGDLVEMNASCQPPKLYGLGLVVAQTLRSLRSGEILRVKVQWSKCNTPGDIRASALHRIEGSQDASKEGA